MNDTTDIDDAPASLPNSLCSDQVEGMETDGAHSIIRGFVSGGMPSSCRSQTTLQPTVGVSPELWGPQRTTRPMFILGGTSSGYDESSIGIEVYTTSLSERVEQGSGHGNCGGRKSRKPHSTKEEAIESDEMNRDVSESAIEDDSSDWETCGSGSGVSSFTAQNMFQRVDSRLAVVSRQSLLTSLMHDSDWAKRPFCAPACLTPAKRCSGTSVPNETSVAKSPDPDSQTPVYPQQDTLGWPVTITSTTQQQSMALSPRTTRRTMLCRELVEPLLESLLRERQCRSTGNLISLERRHRLNDMKIFQRLPEADDYFSAGLLEYHTKGW